jgi:tetratricopeptide (TPR) repeat protein
MFGLFKKDPSKLLKEATSAKKSGNLDEAVSLLRKAYKAISKNDLDYGVKTFLRLPLFLQEAGKAEEAWDEFHRLLTKGYPNQSEDSQLIPMSHSEIYDKMRLFLQREGRNNEATKYGIFSHLSWASGLYLQKRKDEFKDFVAAETIEDTVMKLLKKDKKANLSDEISNLVKHEINNIPKIDFKALGTEVDSAIIG